MHNNYEQARLYTLRQLNLLDTPPSESFDRITRMASQFFNLPIAAVSLTDQDRQWFKSRVGVDHWEIPRFKACCGEVADESELLVIPDLASSATYHDSVLAESGIRFYAGAPLTTQDGYTLGAMCVLGTEPREVTEQEIAVLKDLAAMVMAQIELQHAFGRIDPLTGLPNRSQFGEDLEDLGRDASGELRYALFTEILDVTQTTTLNRVMGPAYLDELIQGAGQGLQQGVGSGVRLYSVGPGQFVHLIPGGNEGEASSEALRIRRELMTQSLAENAATLIRPVVGVAPLRLGEDSPAHVLRTAHSACQDARQGETGVGIYSMAIDASHRRRFALLSGFREALEHPDQLHLVYQPRVTLGDQACRGAEALLRWHHPELGAISPAEFIPLVENTPLARPLTDWVIRTAIAQAVRWYRQGQPICISINISAVNLEEDDFAQRLLSLLDEAELPADCIELELTETALLGHGRAAWIQLERLVEAGIRVAIDDFGTGYSSLAYLQSIPAQVVKIDRSFIHGLDEDARSQTLVKSMIGMAHDLGYHVVAEGVETEPTWRFLERLGCDEFQGFLFAMPMAPDAFEAWLSS
ncbi:sensor domain-containing phosphodiesterase [Litchfieldella xinjiangensis]|uniref:sensor domain-containing phosphodiesterase n=1 Tax=Litchfieldella xinjiangensis TaxID=1166948 RepID=UPI0005BDF58E|nr:GGDEF and EAL domain-containing protein [Halomonas xinjiangensis]